MRFVPLALLLRAAALLSMAAGIMLTVRLLPPFGFLVWIFKVLSGLFSPVVALTGALSALTGLLRRDWLCSISGAVGFTLAARHIHLVARTMPDLAPVFGPGWQQRIDPRQRSRMLDRPWSLRRTGRISRLPHTHVERDRVFAVVPESGRELCCDVWQPPPGAPEAHTAVLYFHSSAWCLVDKDFGTRPLFAYLAHQGYVVMDVAYRLCQETDIAGMTADVYRAVAWMRSRAGEYGVYPSRIVLVGASAGGQIALLAAYAGSASDLVPEELKWQDLSVQAVVSYYGPPDMRDVRVHNALLTSTAVRLLKRVGLGWPLAWLAARVLGLVTGRNARPLESELYEFLQTEDVIDEIMGGSPGEVPELYQRVSPIERVHPDGPPTLLIHGAHDSLVPAASVRSYYRRLRQSGVRAAYVELPQTDHGFDLILSPFSPSMQASIYALERFLALLS